MTGADTIRALVRDVPDFPHSGILFRDVTPLLADPAAFAASIEMMSAPFRGDRVTHVAAIESRGFLFGAPLALALGAGLVLVRKAGKLPSATWRESYTLEYGDDALELHQDACGAASRVLIVDDVLATGGTARAARALVERGGSTVVGLAVLIELAVLNGRAVAGLRTESVLTY